jgi:uncharacterized membrane protein YkvA (DUF1232 family)
MKIRKIGAIFLILLCIVYVLNPTAGVFELLPDNIPFLGNVDEVLAVSLIIAASRYLKYGTFRLIRNK